MINITIFCAKNNLCRQQSKWYCHCNHMTDASINHMANSSCTINNQIFLQKYVFQINVNLLVTSSIKHLTSVNINHLTV